MKTISRRPRAKLIFEVICESAQRSPTAPHIGVPCEDSGKLGVPRNNPEGYYETMRFHPSDTPEELADRKAHRFGFRQWSSTMIFDEEILRSWGFII